MGVWVRGLGAILLQGWYGTKMPSHCETLPAAPTSSSWSDKGSSTSSRALCLHTLALFHSLWLNHMSPEWTLATCFL